MSRPTISGYPQSSQSARNFEGVTQNRARDSATTEQISPQNAQSPNRASDQTSKSHESAITPKQLPEKSQQLHLDLAPEKATDPAALRDWVINTLKENGENFIYVEDQEEFDALLTGSTVENGKPKNIPGPLKALFEQGATLVLNEAGFSDAKLESFNEIKMEKRYSGQPVHKDFRVISLIDADKQSLGVRSPALISRANYHKIPNSELPKPKTLSAEPAQHHEDKEIIDCTTSDWQKLFSHTVERADTANRQPSKTATQQEGANWRLRPSVLDQALNAKRSVVIRNAPLNRFQFQSQFANKQKAFEAAGLSLTLEKGISPEELAATLGSKTPTATDSTPLGEIKPQGTLWTINKANADSFTDEGQYRIENSATEERGEVWPLAPILAQHDSTDESTNESNSKEGTINEQLATTAHPTTTPPTTQSQPAQPTLIVTENLEDGQWHNLMRSPYTFNIGAVEDVSVPEDYQAHVGTVKKHQAPDPFGPPWATATSPTDGPVSLVSSNDPAMTVNAMKCDTDSGDITQLFVTPEMSLNQLAQNITFTLDEAHGISGQTEFSQLFKDLKAGKHVVLQGLENNPGLQKSLATLINPPHYLYLNSDRFNLGASGENALPGKLTIISSDANIFNQYSCQVEDHKGSHASTDLSTLKGELIASGSKTQLIDKVVHTLQQFEAAELLKPDDRAFSYDYLTGLLRTASATDGPKSDQAHQLLKDRFCGDFRSHPEQYAKAKVLFKMTWGKADQAQPGRNQDRHVDGQKLADLIASQPDRSTKLTSSSPVLWQCLNCFSPAVLKSIEPYGDKLSNKAVARFINHYTDAKAAGHPVDIQDVPTDKSRQPLDHRIAKLDAKIAFAFQSNRAVFLKSAAGLGKTHAIKRIAQTLHPDNPKAQRPVTLDVSQVTGSDLHNTIENWATSEDQRLLVIDEANLAPKESLALLKEVFSSNSVTVNGTRHRLSPEHKILFTGNFDSFEGRTVQEVAHDSFNTITLKPFSRDYLNAQFVAPVLGAAYAKGLIPNTIPQADLADVLIDIHELITQSFPEGEFSVRNLEEFLAQAVAAVSNGGVSDENGTLAQRVSTTVSDVYLQALPPFTRETAERWMQTKLATTFGEDITQTPPKPTAFHLADTPNLAPTASTQALAQRLTRWLDSNALKSDFNPKGSKTLGQRGFLIEGPAGRGKDQLVSAVLQQRQWSESKTTYLNAGGDLEGFSNAVKQAAKDGHVLVVSELNLFPSHILEGELNHLLAGDGDVHPDFRLVATVNPPSYSGRKPLSPAILNRMVVNRIEDYPESECIEIAQKIAKTTSKLLSQAKPSAQPLSRDTITTLARAHHKLVSTASKAQIATPTTRQLRRAVEDLVHHPRDIGDVLKTHYLYYLEQLDNAQASKLDPATANSSNPSQSAQDEILNALKLVSQLEKPEWPAPPEFVVTQSAVEPLEYNAKAHEVKVNFNHPALRGQDALAYLSARLLTALNAPKTDKHDAASKTDNAKDGSTPQNGLKGGRLANIEPLNQASKPNKASDLQPFRAADGPQQRRQPIKAVGRRLRSVIKSMNVLGHPRQRRLQGRNNTLKTTTPTTTGRFQAPDPLQFSPTVTPVSGVGGGDIKGTLGTVTAPDKLIRFGVQTINNRALQLNTQNPQLDSNGQRIPVSQVTLNNEVKSDMNAAPAPRTIYLPILKDTQPGESVTLTDSNGNISEKPIEKQNGGWCVHNTPANQKLSYTLYSSEPLNASPKATLGTGKNGLKISPETNTDLFNKINELKAQYKAGDIDAAEVVESLDGFFKDTTNFSYSKDCAADYAHCKTVEDRCNQFIAGKRGVCFEYAHTFARILEQSFDIPARMVCGQRVENSEITAESHEWVEYWHPQAKIWLEADPTGGAASPLQRSPDTYRPWAFHNIKMTYRYGEDGRLYPPEFVRQNIHQEFKTKANALPANYTPPPLHNDPKFIEKLTSRLSALGLFKTDTVATQNYTAENRGTMDIQRALAGHTECFKIRALKDSPKPLGLYMYHSVDSKNWQNPDLETTIPIALVPALNQLIRLGVPLYQVTEKAAYRVEDAMQLTTVSQTQDRISKTSPEFEASAKRDIHLSGRDETEQFFSKLGKIYYQTLAEHQQSTKATPGTHSRKQAESALIQGCLAATDHVGDFLPITVPTGDESLTLTQEAYGRLDRHSTDTISDETLDAPDYKEITAHPARPDNQRRVAFYFSTKELLSDRQMSSHITMRAAAEEVSTKAQLPLLSTYLKKARSDLSEGAALDYIASRGRSSLEEIARIYHHIEPLNNEFAKQMKIGICKACEAAASHMTQEDRNAFFMMRENSNVLRDIVMPGVFQRHVPKPTDTQKEIVLEDITVSF